jgi:hypothetical protein
MAAACSGRDRLGTGQENCRDGDRHTADQRCDCLWNLLALRKGGCSLPAGFVAGTKEERLEQLGKLLHVGLAGKTQAFETGDGRHQDDVLQAASLWPFQLTKAIRHDNSLHAKHDRHCRRSGTAHVAKIRRKALAYC